MGRGELKAVLDTSVAIAYLFKEPGGAILTEAILDGSLMSDVIRAEVVRRLVRDGASAVEALATINMLNIEGVPFDRPYVEAAALIFPYARQANLSFADCICLATAKHLALPVLTADRSWKDLESDIGVEVILIR
jgi:ribonuclease VapC